MPLSVIATKILCAALSVTLSLFFGFLPLLVDRRIVSLNGANGEARRALGQKALAFLLNFGGGVLIANCFCHWLPEVREGR